MSNPSPQDRASLHIEVPLHAASPFPSPGSSFIPPPVQQAHEFALPPAHKLPTKKKDMTNRNSSVGAGSPVTRAAGSSLSFDTDMKVDPTKSASNPPEQSQPQPPLPPPIHSEPDPDMKHDTSSQPTPTYSATTFREPAQIEMPTLPQTPIKSRDRNSIVANKHLSRSSLHSNRPAPPSPGASRPTSTAASLVSTKSKRQSLAVKIRDFAFPNTDERHYGRGPDAPNSKNANDSDSRRNSGWGGFKWGGFSRFSTWAFPGSSRSGSPSRSRRQSGLINGTSYEDDDDEDDRLTPSKQDFDRNFDAPRSPSPAVPVGGDVDTSIVEEAPLVPGFYKALYAFIPEGTAEMALEEDQVVKIIGRGGGVGWAIAVKDGFEGTGPDAHALVPESYLEFLKPLSEDDEADSPDLTPSNSSFS